MVKIIKVVYIYDSHREVEKPAYLTFGSKEKMNEARKILKDKYKCKAVNFTYEDYR